MEENTTTQMTEESVPAEVPAETTTAQAEQPEATTQSEATQTAEPTHEKTFTQAEVDEIVRRRLARASKESQVTAAENAALKSSIACFKAGIRAECMEDAVALANKYVDDSTNFDAALQKVLEKYPNFGSQAPVTQPKNTSVDMQSKKAPADDSALREAMGLKIRKE